MGALQYDNYKIEIPRQKEDDMKDIRAMVKSAERSIERALQDEELKRMMELESEESWVRMASWCFSNSVEPPECVKHELQKLKGAHT